jgi:hypothetical protein
VEQRAAKKVEGQVQKSETNKPKLKIADAAFGAGRNRSIREATMVNAKGQVDWSPFMLDANFEPPHEPGHQPPQFRLMPHVMGDFENKLVQLRGAIVCSDDIQPLAGSPTPGAGSVKGVRIGQMNMSQAAGNNRSGHFVAAAWHQMNREHADDSQGRERRWVRIRVMMNGVVECCDDVSQGTCISLDGIQYLVDGQPKLASSSSGGLDRSGLDAISDGWEPLPLSALIDPSQEKLDQGEPPQYKRSGDVVCLRGLVHVDKGVVAIEENQSHLIISSALPEELLPSRNVCQAVFNDVNGAHLDGMVISLHCAGADHDHEAKLERAVRKNIRKVFADMDLDNDEVLTRAEQEEFYRRSGADLEDEKVTSFMAEQWAKVDVNDDGSISLAEFERLQLPTLMKAAHSRQASHKKLDTGQDRGTLQLQISAAMAEAMAGGVSSISLDGMRWRVASADAQWQPLVLGPGFEGPSDPQSQQAPEFLYANETMQLRGVVRCTEGVSPPEDGAGTWMGKTMANSFEVAGVWPKTQMIARGCTDSSVEEVADGKDAGGAIVRVYNKQKRIAIQSSVAPGTHLSLDGIEWNCSGATRAKHRLKAAKRMFMYKLRFTQLQDEMDKRNQEDDSEEESERVTKRRKSLAFIRDANDESGIPKDKRKAAAEEEAEEEAGQKAGQKADTELIDADKELSKDELFLQQEVPTIDTLEQRRAIDNMVGALRTEEIKLYLDDFEKGVPEQEVVVGSVSLEDVQAQERKMEEDRIAKAQAQAEKYRKQQASLFVLESQARKRVSEKETRSRAAVAERELEMRDEQLQKHRSVHRAFWRAEAYMKEVLQRQQATVLETYGKLGLGRRSEAKRYLVNWNRQPQPIEMRLQLCRAVKNKLPAGRYVVLLTQYDRLGGHPLTWSVIGQHGMHDDLSNADKKSDRGMRGLAQGAGMQRPGVSRAVRHGGRFFDTELRFEQSVFAVCPSVPDMHPSMVFVLEIFLLGGKRDPLDKVVGWGVLPVCGPSFNVVKGKFKIPIILGEMEGQGQAIEKHSDIERMVAQDLGGWLGNMYLEVVHLPRECIDRNGELQREFDVELDFSSRLLRLGEGDNVREEGAGRRGSVVSMQSTKKLDIEEEGGPAGAQPLSPGSTAKQWQKKGAAFGGTAARRGKMVGTGGHSPLKSMKNTFHFGNEGSKGHGVMGRTKSMGNSMRRLLGMNNKQSKSSKGLDGETAAAAAASRRQQRHAVKVGREAEAFTRLRVDSPADYEEYEFSVSGDIVRGGAGSNTTLTETQRKLRFIKQEVLGDFSPWKIHTEEFWVSMCTLALAGWIRVYTHALGQWLYLTTVKVPVFQFAPQLTYVLMKYNYEIVPVSTELTVVAMGIFVNLFLMLVFVGTAYACQKFLHHFPNSGSRFICCWGMVTVLDPGLTFAVDVFWQNFDCHKWDGCKTDITADSCACVVGDAFKLYGFYLREEGSGIVGIVLTGVIYFAIAIFALLVLYIYLIYIHMNGRMLDIYRRLNGASEVFFMPHDFEVDIGELMWLVSKAKKWTGARGTRRKVSVCDYTLTDPLDRVFKEVTTHMALYHEELDGRRKLYRHFLRSHDGAIIEIFGKFIISIGVHLLG